MEELYLGLFQLPLEFLSEVATDQARTCRKYVRGHRANAQHIGAVAPLIQTAVQALLVEREQLTTYAATDNGPDGFNSTQIKVGFQEFPTQ